MKLNYYRILVFYFKKEIDLPTVPEIWRMAHFERDPSMKENAFDGIIWPTAQEDMTYQWHETYPVTKN